jgi:hypothetical protein
MSRFFGLRRRISTVHPSFPISGNGGDPEAGESNLPRAKMLRGPDARDRSLAPVLRSQINFRFPRPELLLECESNSQSDLVMSDRPIFDMASRLHDLEPFHPANGL